MPFPLHRLSQDLREMTKQQKKSGSHCQKLEISNDASLYLKILVVQPK